MKQGGLQWTSRSYRSYWETPKLIGRWCEPTEKSAQRRPQCQRGDL